MPEAAAPVAPVVSEPTKIPPPVLAGSQGAGALAEGAPKVADNPLEFELDVKGNKQKLAFKDRGQLTAMLQKALYADQVIKDGIQAKKGAEALMGKLKTKEGILEVMRDPDINMDVKKFALEIVGEMMDEEKLTPEQKETRELKRYKEMTEKEKASALESEEKRKADEKFSAERAAMSTSLIEAMKKYPDIPQNQATMDAMILNMRAAFKRFGRHLTPEQAMAVYSEQYWKSNQNVLDKMTPEQLLARLGPKTLEKLQQMRLNELKSKTDPKNQKIAGDGSVAKKKHLTEREFDKHFDELAGL
jgi:hypothetical protein